MLTTCTGGRTVPYPVAGVVALFWVPQPESVFGEVLPSRCPTMSVSVVHQVSHTPYFSVVSASAGRPTLLLGSPHDDYESSVTSRPCGSDTGVHGVRVAHSLRRRQYGVGTHASGVVVRAGSGRKEETRLSRDNVHAHFISARCRRRADPRDRNHPPPVWKTPTAPPVTATTSEPGPSGRRVVQTQRPAPTVERPERTV